MAEFHPIARARRILGFTRRRPLAAAAIVLAIAGGASAVYLMWVRDSSLVAVRHVKVVGLRSGERARVRDALKAAARDMTTLHVRMSDLERSVRGFPVVKALRVETDFPSRMTIRVTENVPVALLRTGPSQVPVAADGSLLRALPVRGRRLPIFRVASLPSERRVSSPNELAVISVLGAAPRALRARALRAFTGPRGIVVTLRMGPRLYFHGPDRAAAKWRAVARILADPKLGQSAYIDLQLPSRPAVGGSSPPEPQAAPPGQAAATPAQPQPAPQPAAPVPQAAPATPQSAPPPGAP